MFRIAELELILDFLAEYGLFLAKAVTIVVSILFVIATAVALGSKNRRHDEGHIEIKHLNERYDDIADAMQQAILPEDDYKALKKAAKKAEKQRSKSASDERKARVYVIDFDGDVKISNLDEFREEITSVLLMLEAGDEVVVKVESPGGMVHAYGLAASQLKRIKANGNPLTICVDKVAASGGYMMACIADKIVAAPFAIVGSIGVMAELPNVHRLLKKYDVDYEILTAGEYKRTMSTLGENTEQGRAKFMDDLQETHALFKEFIKDNRPQVDIDKVATGEVWYGSRAVEQLLVDEVGTSDDYLLKKRESKEIFEIKFVEKKSLQEKLGFAAQAVVGSSLTRLLSSLQESRFFR